VVVVASPVDPNPVREHHSAGGKDSSDGARPGQRRRSRARADARARLRGDRGIYTFDEIPLFFSRRPAETMTDFFIRDITEGIADTGVRAREHRRADHHSHALGRPALRPGGRDVPPRLRLHVSRDVVPYLRDHGVSDDQLAAMLVGTPARMLAGG
jgi:hypothetical protein